ncbi:MAG: hypothetical protein A2381_17830 [Bdellovibrionales bacterium RIFOXYB1_FULL_37_110]|nr:MAG: hypothetical protein A2417_08620 [Bdellovibrionales bacterium RIFOXYC1_FULL_37_79]OFZ59832.1 MAG: hypothetical protein A2381_17830 [Bdellovibrionales bacterium RIFOXYB1_FULL_37_110]OFZ65446.1 MAG: hypothetical protein A2577_18365 [Bdellovibrionales bacterium RIFOXYD1_FULL_36_51]
MDTGFIVNDYIFILQLGEELPESYSQLAEYFNVFNITLVPVRLQDFLDIKKDKNLFHVMVVVNDLKSRMKFLDIQKRILNFYLKSRRFHLHDVTSFGKIDIFTKIARFNVYNHYSLPANLKMVVCEIAKKYYQTGKQLHKWPGGTRAKLPV